MSRLTSRISFRALHVLRTISDGTEITPAPVIFMCRRYSFNEMQSGVPHSGQVGWFIAEAYGLWEEQPPSSRLVTWQLVVWDYSMQAETMQTLARKVRPSY